MGTDTFDILSECRRVLCVGGICYIAEVRSRFNGDGGKEEMRRMPRFLNMMDALGFDCLDRDARRSNKFFVLMVFKKVRETKLKEADVEGEGTFLKPCIYKRR